MDRTIKFGRRNYKFVEELITQISAEYVPDWDLLKAVKESVQNAVDEATITGCTATRECGKPNQGEIRDNGRGVAFDNICFIGASGKRGLENVVGQHGEGEMVSFLVAAREGIIKMMASRDWLAIGKLVDLRGHQVLALDVYKTKSPIKGTKWVYQGPGTPDAVKAAWKAFQTARGGRRIRIHRYDKGQLWTRGLKVNRIEDLALGYDLDITPGRDRAGFTWEQAQGEIKRILEKHAKAYHFKGIFQAAISDWYFPKELTLDLEGVSKKVIREGMKQAVGGKSFAWADQNTYEALIADAEQQGISVIRFRSAPPSWVMKAIPNVESAVSASTPKTQPLPWQLKAVVEELQVLIAMSWIQFEATWQFDDNTRACAAGTTVTFARKHVKKMDFQEFVTVLVHEVAHITSGAVDCTRAHTTAVATILARMVGEMVKEDARVAYARAETVFNKYV